VLVELVAAVAPHPLVTPRAERPPTGAGENDDSDRLVLPSQGQCPVDLDQRLRPERIVHLRPVNGDLRDAVVGGLVPNVFPLTAGTPLALTGLIAHHRRPMFGAGTQPHRTC